MDTHSHLPKRLIWIASLFLLTGIGTVGSGIDEYIRKVSSVLSSDVVSQPSAAAITTLVANIMRVSLGVLYLWAGYGLLRRQEQWRRRAIYLSRFVITLLGLGSLVVLFEKVSDLNLAPPSGKQQTVGLPTPLWRVRTFAVLIIGAVMGVYTWALRGLQSDSLRQEFTKKKGDASLTT